MRANDDAEVKTDDVPPNNTTSTELDRAELALTSALDRMDDAADSVDVATRFPPSAVVSCDTADFDAVLAAAVESRDMVVDKAVRERGLVSIVAEAFSERVDLT